MFQERKYFYQQIMNTNATIELVFLIKYFFNV